MTTTVKYGVLGYHICKTPAATAVQAKCDAHLCMYVYMFSCCLPVFPVLCACVLTSVNKCVCACVCVCVCSHSLGTLFVVL